GIVRSHQTPEELLRIFFGHGFGWLWRQWLVTRFPKRKRPNIFIPALPCFFAQILAAVTIGVVIQESVKIFAWNKGALRHGAEICPMLNRPFIWERVHCATIRRAVKRRKLGGSRFKARRYNK